MLMVTEHMDLACVISMKPQNDKIIILLTWFVVIGNMFLLSVSMSSRHTEPLNHIFQQDHDMLLSFWSYVLTSVILINLTMSQ